MKPTLQCASVSSPNVRVSSLLTFSLRSFAGSDTTAIAMRSVFYHLMKNPEVYAELIEVHSRLYTLLPVIQLTVPVFAKPGALFRQ